MLECSPNLWLLHTESVEEIFKDTAPSRGKDVKGFSGQDLLGNCFPFHGTQTHEYLLPSAFKPFLDVDLLYFGSSVISTMVTLNSRYKKKSFFFSLSSLIFQINKVAVDITFMRDIL